MRVVIAGGGTAGHVNPGLALAHALKGDDVVFVGTTRGAEARLVPASGFELRTLEVRGYDRSRPASFFSVAGTAAGAIVRARAILKELETEVVVGLGGYVSLPVSLAARSRGMPLVLHEQNIVLGLANRVCRPFARSLAVSFEETLRTVGPKGVLVGNPVSPELVNADVETARKAGVERFELDPARKTLLIFGGSQGAQTVNRAARGLAERWADRGDVQIVHITGPQNESAPAERTEGLLFRSVPYVERMAEAYAIADLAICRGGATTVAEICVMGVPALIVPYPYHRDRQQELHGRVLERVGAAVVVGNDQATAERLGAEAERILSDPERLASMVVAARSFARPDAAQKLAELVRTSA